ncbi:MAG: hypothetical protein LEGION0403_FIIPPAGN_02138 [Legionella sp.]|uniref:hypothetical protein n=1 Tax=Legionella sp. TaxID=459 RepID=UPI003D134B24
MIKYLSKLNAHFFWWIKKYHLFCSQIKEISAYEITDVKRVNGKYELIIQINGTGKVVPYTPREIAEDEVLLKEFSPKDTQLIHYCNFEELKEPRYKIVGHKFSEKNTTLLCIKDRESGVIKDYTVPEVVKDKSFLKQCSPEDAYKIGYFYRSEIING